jgi:hypothetical protein
MEVVMRAKTMRVTRTCDFCGLPITYRKEETLKQADAKNEHLHKECKKG